jgi:poly(3-hydroxybutyrate) depolymerase
MRSRWSLQAIARRLVGGAMVAALASLTSACTVSNEGNITTPPPPSVFPSSGGSSTGGSSSGGSAGSSVIPGGGSSGEGAANDLSKPWKSTGCGMPPPEGQVPTIPGSRTGYTEYTVMQAGATLGAYEPTKAGERQFFVRVPADYNQDTPYRIVYIGQGCGANRAGKTNTYPMFNEMQGGTEQAIYVGLSVPDNDANPGCYDNNTGPQSQEWEAFDLIHSFIESKFCVDNNRIHVTGYSTGGWLANMWGCYFGGVPDPPRKFSPKWAVRGHAAVTGSLPPNQPACNGPSAGFWLHDAGDKSNLIATNIAAINLNLQTNGCQGDYENGPKQPWLPADEIAGLSSDICQEYTGCPAEVAKNYPIVFCTTNGLGHGDQSSSAIPVITKFFDLMNPTQ